MAFWLLLQPFAEIDQQVWFEGEAPTTYRASLMFGGKALVVATHRCSNCGHLESFARA
jgi:hypothetical protein